MLAVELNLKTVQVDFEAAFTHADLEEDVYIEMPRGFQEEGKVLKLKKSLYGLTQASRNWFLHLKEKLEDQDFVQSTVDPCLFIHPRMLCLCYVDDCLFLSDSEEDIYAMLEALRSEHLKLKVESDVAGYLGVDLHHRKDGSIELLQTGLIDRILDALHLNDTGYAKKTPATYGSLPKDEDGEPAGMRFNYRSVVGMMGYLEHSRPEIKYAVSACARFVHNPKRIHEEALIRIGLYLKGTRNNGLIIKPQGVRQGNETLPVEMYCDADFAGLWGYEQPMDPTCVKSRAGYVILIGGNPVLWGSKLIPQIALSTMEAEYYSMSMAMKQLIPLLDLIKEVYPVIGLPDPKEHALYTTVYEDNSACLQLAKTEMPTTTPRSKHFATKYHWFRDKLDEYNSTLTACKTGDMLADLMTKALRVARFEELRQKLMGW
jgi:hypothetical protein